MRDRLAKTLELVKFSHTVFALPFALLSAFLAAGGPPPAPTLLLIVVAMVGGRTGAMAVNRIADRKFDALNPRTARRPLVTGELSVGYAVLLAIASFAMLVVAAWRLNRLALSLSPVAIAVLVGYSFAKRFTWASHLFLGLALAGAPVGAWIAVTGAIAWPPILIGLAVLFWTAGFDIIYACQDTAVDRGLGLHSIPARFGVRRALHVSSAFHAVMVGLLVGLPLSTGAGPLYLTGVTMVAMLLFYEHRLVGPNNLDRVDEAFFTVNGLVSVVLFLSVALDLALYGG